MWHMWGTETWDKLRAGLSATRQCRIRNPWAICRQAGPAKILVWILKVARLINLFSQQGQLTYVRSCANIAIWLWLWISGDLSSLLLGIMQVYSKSPAWSQTGRRQLVSEWSAGFPCVLGKYFDLWVARSSYVCKVNYLQQIKPCSGPDKFAAYRCDV